MGAGGRVGKAAGGPCHAGLWMANDDLSRGEYSAKPRRWP